MGHVIINGPPDGDWCPICLMRAKQKQWELSQDLIKAGAEAPGDKVTVITWPDGLTREINEAAYFAVAGDAPQLGPMRICWNDVAGLGPAATPRLVEADGIVPPGLIRGRG
jgi:hypothetical protein